MLSFQAISLLLLYIYVERATKEIKCKGMQGGEPV